MFYAKRKDGDVRGTFFNKCYICETDIIFGETEHRIPKCADNFNANLEQESNLFWSCVRCNRKKSYGYWEPSNECRYSYGFIGIIDCTKCDPNKYIEMKIGDCSNDYKITLNKKADAPCIENTLKLLGEIYGVEKNIVDIDIENLRTQIFSEVYNFRIVLHSLFCCIRCNKSEEEINCCKNNVINGVLPSSPFSAFKLTCIKEEYKSTHQTIYKCALEEILNDPRLNPVMENTTCSVIQ